MMYLAATVFPAPLSPLQTGLNRRHDTTQAHTRELAKRDHSPDDDALVLRVDHHVPVHVVGQGVDVRRVLVLGLQRPAQASAEGGSEVSRMNENSLLPGKARSLCQ